MADTLQTLIGHPLRWSSVMSEFNVKPRFGFQALCFTWVSIVSLSVILTLNKGLYK